MDLSTVIRRLYESEINCGLQSFWDGGIDVWIGDYANGRHVEGNFSARQMGEIAAWLDIEARRLYPQSDYARGAAAT